MQQSLSQYIDELKTTTAQKSAIESELSIARNIQMSMLSTDFPERPDLAIYAMLTPAKAVGGDLYDFFLRDNSLYFCIGDVSGKGVPAALVMTSVCGAFRLLAESETEPVRIVSRMNDMMIRDSSMTIFVTFFAGVLDLDTGHLRYCNAGHKAPLVAGQPLPVRSNLPIGAMSDWKFEAQEADLAPGSTLFLYTDGLDEAEDAGRQQFGKARINEVMQTTSPQPRTLIERMTQAVADFVGDTEQSDDLTMLAIQWKKCIR
jgi:sigma-B regulation protein RsbU (phosphoserine phosphatase)